MNKTPKDQAEALLQIFYEIRNTMTQDKKSMPPLIMDLYVCSKDGLLVFYENMTGQENIANFEFQDCVDVAKLATKKCGVCGAKMSYYGYLIVGTMKAKKDRDPMLVAILYTKESSQSIYQYYNEKTSVFFGEVRKKAPEKKFKHFIANLDEKMVQPKPTIEDMPAAPKIQMEILEPALKDVVTNGIKPQIKDALRLAVKYQAETGFLINIKVKRLSLEVTTSNIIIGNKEGVPLDPEFDMFKDKTISKALLTESREEVVDAITRNHLKRYPNTIGDFHVHLSAKNQLTLMDMTQTMLYKGLLTVLGQPLSSHTAKITYIIWNPSKPEHKGMLLEALEKLEKVPFGNMKDIKEAQKYEQNILHSEIAKQYSFETEY